MNSRPVTEGLAAVFDHVGLSVRDLEHMTVWYESTLGMAVELRFDHPDKGVRGSMLVHPSGYRIELIERLAPRSLPIASLRLAEPARGANAHLCLRVIDVDAGFATLVGYGATPFASPAESRRPEGGRIAGVLDPEGNLIELIDRH